MSITASSRSSGMSYRPLSRAAEPIILRPAKPILRRAETFCGTCPELPHYIKPCRTNSTTYQDLLWYLPESCRAILRPVKMEHITTCPEERYYILESSSSLLLTEKIKLMILYC